MADREWVVGIGLLRGPIVIGLRASSMVRSESVPATSATTRLPGIPVTAIGANRCPPSPFTRRGRGRHDVHGSRHPVPAVFEIVRCTHPFGPCHPGRGLPVEPSLAYFSCLNASAAGPALRVDPVVVRTVSRVLACAAAGNDHAIDYKIG